MKTKKVLIYFVILLICLKFSNSALTDGLMAYWSFEGNAQDNTTNNKDGSLSGTPTLTTGILGQGYEFSGAGGSDYISISDAGDFFCNDVDNNACIKSVICWDKPVAISTERWILTKWNSNSVYERMSLSQYNGLDGTYNYVFFTHEIGNGAWLGVGYGGAGQWAQHAFTINTTSGYVINAYNNGTLTRTYTNTRTAKSSNTNSLFIGSLEGTGGYYDGVIDECGIWNRTLSSSEILEMYNNVLTGVSYPFVTTTGTTPSLTLTTNIINNSNNGFLDYSDGIYKFNVTGVSVNNSLIYSGRLYLNGVSNQTFSNHNFANPLQINISFLNEEIARNITINFYNENASSNKSYNVYFDGINPEIAFNSWANNSIFYKDGSADAIPFSVSAGDNNLYALNVTIVNATNSRIFANLSQALTTTTFTQDYVFNYSNMSLGRYTVIFEAWDSHTATQIQDFNAKKDLTTKKLTFDEITISTQEDIKGLDYTKEKDKYSFEIDFKDKKPEYSVIIESTGKLEYLQNSNYKGHIVDFQANKWVDFEGDHDITISKLASNKYEVKVKPKASKSDTLFKFKSIGELNYIATSYNFNISLGSAFYANDNNTASSINNFGLLIFNSTFSQDHTTTNGVISSNITQGTYNLTFYSEGYLNRTYSDVTLSAGGSITGSLNATGAFTVYIKDQITLSLINKLVTLEFIPQTANESKNYTTTNGVKYISDLGAGEYIIRYASANYSNAFYYFTLLNGTSETFTIYMLPETQTSNVTAYVYDEVANAVSNAIIHVQRYDLNTNTYVTVEIVKTNFEGRAIIHITKNSEFYKFLIYYNGDLKLNTDASYIYDDSIAFQIYIGSNLASNFFEAYNVDYSLTYNPVTDNVAFTYSDATNTITNGTLKLFNATNGALYNISSVASTSATILLFARNISGATYQARAYVTLDGKEYYLNSLNVEYPTAPMQEDGSALFYIFLLTIVFIFIGFFDLTIAVILTPIPLMIASIIGLIPITPLITIPMELLALIVAYLLNINKG